MYLPGPVPLQPRLNKMVLLCSKAYNFSLEAVIGTCRDIFGFLRSSVFIWTQEVQNSVHGSLRKFCLKRTTLTWKQAWLAFMSSSVNFKWLLTFDLWGVKSSWPSPDLHPTWTWTWAWQQVSKICSLCMHWFIDVKLSYTHSYLRLNSMDWGTHRRSLISNFFRKPAGHWKLHSVPRNDFHFQQLIVSNHWLKLWSLKSIYYRQINFPSSQNHSSPSGDPIMDGVLTTNDDGDLDYGQYEEDRGFYPSGGEVR